ncbi:MAG TPA: TIGR01458 family HAD-type hydrolase [Ktedonobacteraceae bacterium]
MSQIQGVLLDVDGVLHVSMSPLPAAAAVLRWLGEKSYPFSCVTNTTTSSRSTLARTLQSIGLPVEKEQLVTAPVATANYIRQHCPGKRCWLLTKGDTAEDFAGIELTEDRADLVVIGGAEELFSYETMNRVFRLLMGGAELLAMHSNLYWKTRQGLQLDSGPYVYALECATGKQATVLGKPNRAFFEQALNILNAPASAAIMVGDDLENDVQASQQAGLRGLLVTTGKHSTDSPLLQHIYPDAILPSIADLPAWLENQAQGDW